MAAEPVVSQIVKLHAGFRRYSRSFSNFGSTGFHARMADRLRVGLCHFTAPLAVCKQYGDFSTAVGLQHQFGIRDALPAACIRNNTGILCIVVVSNCKGVVCVDVHMAAEPAVGELIQLHTVFRCNCSGFGSFRTAGRCTRVADRLSIGFGDFAAPDTVGQCYGDIRAAVRVQHDFRIGNLFPLTAVRYNTGIFRIVVVGDCEGIVCIEVHMAAEPAVGELIEFHAAFAAFRCSSCSSFRRLCLGRGFRLCRCFRRLRFCSGFRLSCCGSRGGSPPCRAAAAVRRR